MVGRILDVVMFQGLFLNFKESFKASAPVHTDFLDLNLAVLKFWRMWDLALFHLLQEIFRSSLRSLFYERRATPGSQ